MDKFLEIKKLLEKIDGWITDNELQLLFNLAKNCGGKGVIVEIGSWKGKSTICLASGSKIGSRTKVFAIDPHTGSKEHIVMFGKVNTFLEFKNNIKNAGVEDIVEPIVATSYETAKNFNKPIELIFIDGTHEYELVKLDFNLWFPKVINEGLMVFHDTMSDGPKKVVNRYLYWGNRFKNVKFVDGITYAIKVDKVSFIDRVKNIFMYFILLFYIFYADINRKYFYGKLRICKPIKKFFKF